MDNGEIENLIRELIEKTNIKTNSISINEESGGNTWFSVEVSEPHHYIGNDGEALNALNHLVRRIVESKTIFKNSEDAGQSAGGQESREGGILIDINGFQKKRVENIRAIAHMMSERARYFKSNIEVDPMSAFERRIVHEFLSGADDLKTESVGYGGTRRVVIKYVGTI